MADQSMLQMFGYASIALGVLGVGTGLWGWFSKKQSIELGSTISSLETWIESNSTALMVGGGVFLFIGILIISRRRLQQLF